MRKIPLTQGKFALVDDGDFEQLSRYKWYAKMSHHKASNKFYAARNRRKADGKQETIFMHSVIVKTPKGFGTDHQDGDSLNNQRENLRVCTSSENAMNRGAPKSGSSGFKGVTWHKRDEKWEAQIQVGGKKKHLGYFSSKEEAYQAYCDACVKLHGEFARVV